MRLRSGGSQFKASQAKIKVYKAPPQQKKSRAWWYMPIMPATEGSIK
jgi:hypothetical protein